MSALTRESLATVTPDNAFRLGIPWWSDNAEAMEEAREAIAPYASHAANWAATGAETQLGGSSVADMVARPLNFPASLPLFLTWLRERNPASSLIPTVETASDTRRAQGEALAAMRRREADAKRDAHQARQDLIAARVALAEAEERARNLADAASRPSFGIDGTFVSEDAKREHFLEYARQATLHGNCSEYDRHVADSGVRYTRDWFRDHGYTLESREEVSYEVTVTFTYTTTLDAGEDWDPSEWEAMNAARDAGLDSFDVTEISRDPAE